MLEFWDRFLNDASFFVGVVLSILFIAWGAFVTWYIGRDDDGHR